MRHRSRIALSELEVIVGELEGGKLGLADALARYEQGVKHLKSCHGLLERAERRIEILSGIDADGKPSPSRSTSRNLRRWKNERPPAASVAAAKHRRFRDGTAAKGDDVDEGSRLF